MFFMLVVHSFFCQERHALSSIGNKKTHPSLIVLLVYLRIPVTADRMALE